VPPNLTAKPLFDQSLSFALAIDGVVRESGDLGNRTA